MQLPKDLTSVGGDKSPIKKQKDDGGNELFIDGFEKYRQILGHLDNMQNYT